MNCRHCSQTLTMSFLDLGSAPPSNAYLTAAQLAAPETWYPLRLLVCEHCWLVQTEDHAGRDELFSADYAYFSATSKSWVEHARSYVERMVERFALTPSSTVVEVASNDGYLLQFVQKHGIPCYGIEPTHSTATAARTLGLDVIEEFFGVTLAERLVSEGRAADLTAANNVLAHVPDINDFVGGFARLLTEHGVATFEFPHLLRLVQGAQFDTVYHEHYSYLSLGTVQRIFAANGLSVFDVEELSTHGGSLRVYAQRADTGQRAASTELARVLDDERVAGMETPAFYSGFQQVAERVKDGLLRFLLDAKRDGQTVAGYGAAAKGNTLLNFAGVRPDLLAFVCDAAPSKQGKFMPGSRIPIEPPAALDDCIVDFVLVLPWNISAEVRSQLKHLERRGTRFVVAVPELSIS